MRKQELISRLKTGPKLSKVESDELGALTNRDLAPETGDSFVEALSRASEYLTKLEEAKEFERMLAASE